MRIWTIDDPMRGRGGDVWPPEMLLLSDVRLDQSSLQLISEVDSALTKVGNLGEFSPELRERISREFLPDRISDTLVIESIYVNARLTRAVLEGQAIGDIDSHGVVAVENVNEANILMEHEARSGRVMTVQLVREINKRIVAGTGEVSQEGAFRDINVSITGADLQPPDWTQILGAMQEFETQVSDSELHPLVIAAWAHWAIARLHPFENGNGRTARLVQDFFLIRGGLIPVGVPAGKRAEYYLALSWADTELDLDPLIAIIADAELTALEKTYSLAREDQEARTRVAKIAKQVQGTAQKHKGREFEVWLRRMEIVGDEIERILREFNSHGSGVFFRIDRYESKSRELWEEIRDHGWASHTWFMRINVHVHGRTQLNVLLYLRRHRLDWIAEETEHLRSSVAIFIDVCGPNEKFRPGDKLQDSFVLLREVAVDPHGYWIFEPVVSGTTEVSPGVRYHGETTLWTGHHVDHLSETITSFMEQMLDRVGARS